ncbi:hypothetical protein [Desulforamulus ruminis]|uniref:hypothetical protein n=1 Tax=Desulforamulus ruminis TaxID=1564 RepID=UPI0023525DC2|nr:hypothetical protein [Desulforamulus ruminis]
MNNLDDIVRAKEKLELIVPPERSEGNDIFIMDTHSSTLKNKKFPVFYIKSLAIGILIILLLAGTGAAAYALSGEGFYKQFFADKANSNAENDYSYINTEQIDDMASTTVVNTDELTIDVMSMTISGNTAEFMLKVTANKLDSVLHDTGIEPLKNYRFNNDIGGSLFKNFERASTRYYYSDEDERLAPNQFEILYTLIGTDTFKKGQYTIKLSHFGYFTANNDKVTDFVSIYDGSWQFDIAFDPVSDISKSVFVNKEITIGGHDFSLNNINVTPLACTISLKCNQDSKYLNENLDEIFKAFTEDAEDCSVILADGTILSSDQFEKSFSGGEEGFTKVLIFNVPVTVNDIVLLTLFGTEYSLE